MEFISTLSMLHVPISRTVLHASKVRTCHKADFRPFPDSGIRTMKSSARYLEYSYICMKTGQRHRYILEYKPFDSGTYISVHTRGMPIASRPNRTFFLTGPPRVPAVRRARTEWPKKKPRNSDAREQTAPEMSVGRYLTAARCLEQGHPGWAVDW